MRALRSADDIQQDGTALWRCLLHWPPAKVALEPNRNGGCPMQLPCTRRAHDSTGDRPRCQPSGPHCLLRTRTFLVEASVFLKAHVSAVTVCAAPDQRMSLQQMDCYSPPQKGSVAERQPELCMKNICCHYYGMLRLNTNWLEAPTSSSRLLDHACLPRIVEDAPGVNDWPRLHTVHQSGDHQNPTAYVSTLHQVLVQS